MKNRSYLKKTDLKTLAAVYRSVFDALFEETGARVLVDSSKIPLIIPLLQHMPGYDIYMLHLVRDPRAVTYSEYYRKKTQIVSSGKTTQMVMSLWLSLWRWRRLNNQADRYEQLPNYKRLRYESFLDQPIVSLREILSFLDENPDLIVDRDGKFPVGDLHIFLGKPDRMARDVVLRKDIEWQRAYPQAARMLVTLTTRGMIDKYGYLK